MPGKYSHLKGSLTRFQLEQDYNQRVDERRQAILETIGIEGPINLQAIGGVLIRARAEKERLSELEKEQNLIIEAMTRELVDRLETENFDKVTLSNGISISIKDDVYCSVNDKPAFHQWVKDSGNEELFSVNYQTMSSMVKDCLINGTEIPPGIGTYFKQGIVVRGEKNG